MALFRTIEPEVEPVTLAEAKAHMRVDHDSEDELISGLIRAARQEFERSTGVALIEQGWRVTLDVVPRSGIVTARLHPVKEIVAVTAYGSEGEASLVDPGNYRLDGHSRPAAIAFARLPDPLVTANGIEIDLVAGFGETGADVPDLIKRALLLLVAHWYEFRAALGPGDQPAAYPAGYDRLIAPWRAARL